MHISKNSDLVQFIYKTPCTYIKGEWCIFIGTMPSNIVSTFCYLPQDYTNRWTIYENMGLRRDW
jgi:hypothetical protein